MRFYDVLIVRFCVFCENYYLECFYIELRKGFKGELVKFYGFLGVSTFSITGFSVLILDRYIRKSVCIFGIRVSFEY